MYFILYCLVDAQLNYQFKSNKLRIEAGWSYYKDQLLQSQSWEVSLSKTQIISMLLFNDTKQHQIRRRCDIS